MILRLSLLLSLLFCIEGHRPMATPPQIDSLFQEVATRVAAATDFALRLQERLSANIMAASTLAKIATQPGAYFFDISYKVEQGARTSGVESIHVKSYLAEGFVLVNHRPGVVECKLTTVKAPRVLYEETFKFFGAEAASPDAHSIADHITGLLVKSEE